jgi:hypothetical protein
MRLVPVVVCALDVGSFIPTWTMAAIIPGLSVLVELERVNRIGIIGMPTIFGKCINVARFTATKFCDVVSTLFQVICIMSGACFLNR